MVGCRFDLKLEGLVSAMPQRILLVEKIFLSYLSFKFIFKNPNDLLNIKVNISLNQDLENYSPWTKSSLMSIFVKFYWKKALPILLSVICGFLHATIVESSSCDRDDLPCKPKIFMAFYIAGPNIFTLLTQLIWKNVWLYQNKYPKV